MRTMHPVLKRGGLYWDRDLLPPANYRERFARVQKAIAAAGDDAWLFYGDVERYGAVAWFSNFLPRTRAALALVPREGEPTLLLAVGLRDVPAAKTLTWVDDVRPYGNLPKSLAALIEERGLTAARVGLAGVEELLPMKAWSEIAAALPGLWTRSRTGELNAMRARKDECEIAAIRATGAIVREAFEECAASIKPGRTMREVTAELDRACRVRAAEDVRVMAASGEQAGQSLRPADDRVLKSGDSALVYLAVEAQRYWAEGARTFVVGRASDEVRGLFARGERATNAMRVATRAGATGGGIALAAQSALGGGALAASAAGYGFGNGVGLDENEYPLIAAGSAETLADSAAVALRALGHEGGLGVALAETLLVRGASVESLTGAPGLIECL